MLVAAGHLERRRDAREVDGVAAAARGLAADRAVAELVGLRRMRGDGEAHGAAAAGPVETDGHDVGSRIVSRVNSAS